MNQMFLREFLLLSDWRTVLLVATLLLFLAVIHIMKKRIDFGVCILSGMLLGLVLGLIVQVLGAFPDDPLEYVFVSEASAWFGLLGNGFMALIRMLVIPLVMVSIINVVMHMEEGRSVGKLVKHTLAITMIMVTISAGVGLLYGVIFQVGAGMVPVDGQETMKEVTSFIDTLTNLIPANPITAMNEMNIIALVIFSAFIGVGAWSVRKGDPEGAAPFYRFIESFHKIMIHITLFIIELMPYAVVPLLANTIALRGLDSVRQVGIFILVIYLALATMFIIQMVLLAIFRLNPGIFIRKGLQVMILAFTSRSSVGVLPATIDALTKRMGVNEATAGFSASFGTTAGMQGCAGIFPALLLVYVANVSGIPIDFTFIFMSILVIALGSLGIAGIPGTATMAASVSLSGMGMGTLFPLISPILSIDPLIDMGRTMINVTGSMTNTIIVDKMMKTLDEESYRSELKK